MATATNPLIGGPATGVPNTMDPTKQITATGFPPQISGGGALNTLPGGAGASFGGTAPQANSLYGTTGTRSSTVAQQAPGLPNSAALGNTNPLTNPQTSGGGPANTTPNTGVGAQSPGNPYAQFTSTNNLIGSQITTNPSDRTVAAQGATDAAKNAVTGYQFQPFNAQAPLDTSQTQNLLQAGNNQTQSQSGFNYNPVAGTDLTGAQNYLSQAGKNIGPSSAASGLMGQGQTGGFGYSGDTTALRGTTQDQLDKLLNNTPDRASLASDSYNMLLERSQPQQQAEDRGLAQKTAALGRVGSGMFNSQQQDLATVRERERDLARRDLANNAASMSLSDQNDKLNAARGVTSDFSGYDLGAGNLNLGYQNSNNAERGAAFDRTRALGNDTFNQNLAASSQSANLAGIARNDGLTERDALRTSGLDNNNVLTSKAAGNRTLGSDLYGMQSDAANRATNERDSGLNYDQNIFNNRQNIFNTAGADEQRLLGNDRYAADEQRGERDYQYGLSRDAQGDQRTQALDQEALLNGRFQRGQGLTSAGYANDPTGVLGQQAQNYGQQASDSYGSAGDLFGQYALNRNQNPATAPRPNAYAQ